MVDFTSSGPLELQTSLTIHKFISTATNEITNPDGSIAAATNSSTITLGPPGEYELFIMSDSIVAAVPLIVYVRTASSVNLMIFGCPVAGVTSRRFQTSENGLQIIVRNNSASSGSLYYGIVRVTKG